MISAILGAFILVACSGWLAYRMMYGSKKRIKDGQGYTIYDVMVLGAGFPNWWRWWYGLLPLAAIITIAQIVKLIPWYVYAIAFFAYIGALVLYEYLAALNWVKRQHSSKR